MVFLANKLAEKQLREGTASTAVITHYLKLGSERERLEREKLEKENELLRAKTENIESAKQIKELYAEAINAMKTYNGQEVYDSDV